MDERWRNLGVIVAAILIVAVLAYFLPALLFSGVSFEDGKERILGMWDDAGVVFDVSNPVSEPARLNFLKADLEEYKEELSSLGQRRDRDALLEYVDIHIKIVEGMQLYRKLDGEYNLFLGVSDDASEICSSIGLLDALATSSSALDELISRLSEAKQGFSDAYPEYASEVPVEGEIATAEGTRLGDEAEELRALCESEGYL